MNSSEKSCYCGSFVSFSECCEPFLITNKTAPTAEKLMRSRYSAYVVQDADYLLTTTHISTRKNHSKSDILEWSKSNNWLKLEIISSAESTVEFKAYYLDNLLHAYIHHEKSRFKFENGKWFYVDGKFY